jgi:hypothetical protein
MSAISGKNWAIYGDDLGRALVDLATDASLERSCAVSNEELVERGKRWI